VTRLSAPTLGLRQEIFLIFFGFFSLSQQRKNAEAVMMAEELDKRFWQTCGDLDLWWNEQSEQVKRFYF
jgi:hypothetical protein